VFLRYLGENELSNFHVYWVLFPQNVFILDPDAVRLHECPWGTIRTLALTVLLSCQVLLVFMTLFYFNFLNFMLTV